MLIREGAQQGRRYLLGIVKLGKERGYLPSIEARGKKTRGEVSGMKGVAGEFAMLRNDEGGKRSRSWPLFFHGQRNFSMQHRT